MDKMTLTHTQKQGYALTASCSSTRFSLRGSLAGSGCLELELALRVTVRVTVRLGLGVHRD